MKIEEVQKQSAAALASLIQRLIGYAIDNLHRLIVDENGNIVWPEAAQNLAKLVDGTESDDEMKVKIIYAIEPIIMTRSYEELDALILKLPIGVRMITAAAIAAAKTFLARNEAYIKEIVQNWDSLIDAALRAGPYAYLHDAIMQSPNLRAWIQGYVIHKLNISADEYRKYARQENASGGR